MTTRSVLFLLLVSAFMAMTACQSSEANAPAQDVKAQAAQQAQAPAKAEAKPGCPHANTPKCPKAAAAAAAKAAAAKGDTAADCPHAGTPKCPKAAGNDAAKGPCPTAPAPTKPPTVQRKTVLIKRTVPIRQRKQMAQKPMRHRDAPDAPRHRAAIVPKPKPVIALMPKKRRFPAPKQKPGIAPMHRKKLRPQRSSNAVGCTPEEDPLP